VKTAAIIQARIGSSRLPGKVLLEITGKPMLQWVVERAGRAETIDEVVVATTTDPSDDDIAVFCRSQGISFTRGSVHDVLDRYVHAARLFNTDVVVRLTADCPLIDPGLVDETVTLLVSGTEDGGPEIGVHARPRSSVPRPLDFAANRLPPPWSRTYPIGLDVEVATMDALERAWSETSEKHHREHVMPYFYDDLPPEPLEPGRVYTTSRGFRVAQLHHESDCGAIRWTVDTPEDLEAVRRLAALLPPDFTWLDVLETWKRNPEVARINAGIRHKTARDIDDRS
jgi:spore coat polysaccharide biosynthesis protein SpsF